MPPKLNNKCQYCLLIGNKKILYNGIEIFIQYANIIPDYTLYK